MTVECDRCGQLAEWSPGWTVRGWCDECRAGMYGTGATVETVRLFDCGPVPLPGQTEMEGIE